MGWVPSEKEAFKLLEEEECSESVLTHCEGVLSVIKKLINGLDVDKDIMIAGAILHDIGRSKTHGVKHGIMGGEILRKHGVDERVVKITERHVGAGIPREESVKIGLGDRNLMPETIEEKIVCYADKLLIGNYVATETEALYDFKKKIGENHPAIGRMKKLFQDVKIILEGKK